MTNRFYNTTDHDSSILKRRIPVTRTVKTKDGDTLRSQQYYDLMAANYGVDQGLGGDHVAKDFDDDAPYTPAWQEKITGVSREKVIKIAREFADNADQTRGRSMIIIGAAMNHWYHMDMNYRGIINMLVSCVAVLVNLAVVGLIMWAKKNSVRKQAGTACLCDRLDAAAHVI